MRFSTPSAISNLLYIGCDFITSAAGEEKFGISIGRFYLGYYTQGCPGVSGWCAGILDDNGCLK